jgi:hypothetical protein
MGSCRARCTCEVVRVRNRAVNSAIGLDTVRPFVHGIPFFPDVWSKMPPKDRPNTVGTDALNVRIPKAMLEWLRSRSAKNSRNIGQELKVILEPVMHADARAADVAAEEDLISNHGRSDGSEFGDVSSQVARQRAKGRKNS